MISLLTKANFWIFFLCLSEICQQLPLNILPCYASFQSYFGLLFIYGLLGKLWSLIQKVKVTHRIVEKVTISKIPNSKISTHTQYWKRKLAKQLASGSSSFTVTLCNRGSSLIKWYMTSVLTTDWLMGLSQNGVTEITPIYTWLPLSKLIPTHCILNGNPVIS